MPKIFLNDAKHLTFVFSLLFLTALFFVPQKTLADNFQGNEKSSSDVLPVMPQVLVEAEKISPTTGTAIINREIIQQLPLRHGSLNEIIGIIPGIQFNYAAEAAATQGDINPPLISIAGSRYYDNNYTINGIGNNNPLDPASNTYGDSSKLPGRPQIHFLNPRLIDQITVYNSNIPAEFGEFSGGQIDVKTIEPQDEFWGRLNYRTTNDSWTQLHIHPLKENDFYHSTSINNQPKFTKQDLGFTFNLPLTPDTGLITSYQQLRSRIPLSHLDGKQTLDQKNENFYLMLQHLFPDDGRISLTVLSSPTTRDYFFEDVKDSNYRNKSDNHSIGLKYEKDFSPGNFQVGLSYTDQKIYRDADSAQRYYWSPTTPTIDWESGREGGLGDLKTAQREVALSTSFSFHNLALAQTEHQIKTGLKLNHSYQSYHRPLTNYYYYSPVLDDSLICAQDDPACISNEQYLSRRTVYQVAAADTEVMDAAFYLQDVISWKRIELFPGIRASYDDFTDELNLAPRFSASLDLFGDQKSILFAGRNRYYSGTLLTQSLYQSIEVINQQRTTPGNSETDWNSSVSYHYRDTPVKIPYTDETTFGLIQRLFAGELKVQYIEKSSRDELTRSRIDNPSPEPDEYILTNLGRSEHDSLQISWQRTWKNHAFEINGTWQETTTTTLDYDSTLNSEDLAETIWYKGKELFPHEIPRNDFNLPLVAHLIYSYKAPKGITLTNVTRYRGPYWRLWNTREKKSSVINPDQPDPYIYERRESHSIVTFDWHLSWNIPTSEETALTLTLDILNVFNKKAKIGYQTGAAGYDYEVGRQFWGGLEFNF